jgi:hypothetical protein
MMARFIEIPSLDLHGAKQWKLEERLVYESDLMGIVIVPAGFITDLASIPRVFQTLVPKIGKHRLPAIVHDYLVTLDNLDRKMADKVFLEAMKVCGVNPVRRRLMYWAVSIHTFFKRGKK